MIVQINDDSDITMRDFDAEGFHISAADPDLAFGPMEMFVTAVGLCVYSVLVSYAEQIRVDPGDIEVRLRWDYAEQPYRIEPIEVDISWPSLPASRRGAAKRAAEHCTLHHTLGMPTEVKTQVVRTKEAPRPEA